MNIASCYYLLSQSSRHHHLLKEYRIQKQSFKEKSVLCRDSYLFIFFFSDKQNSKSRVFLTMMRVNSRAINFICYSECLQLGNVYIHLNLINIGKLFYLLQHDKLSRHYFIFTFKTIEAFQSISLRTITSAPWYISNHTLHKDLNIEALKLTIIISPSQPTYRISTYGINPGQSPRRLKRRWCRDLSI
ncbi:zinc finger MYM-type protein 6-like [Aphis craccivora]|uniref:Zinc finger MYM-type protein 6-like n=1 Tax=Aphis craccivora TaxID=307492 RepID=A0A6G0Z3P1_APHCR|nr:zinc finger MYM-type protein 6-like [Aphis craccivora]